MTREELLKRKIDVDDSLARARIDLDEAKAIAASSGQFVEPRKYAGMQRSLNRLRRESQRLQFELRGDRKQLHQGEEHQTFLQEFLLSARRMLDRDVYLAIAQDANAKVPGLPPQKDTMA